MLVPGALQLLQLLSFPVDIRCERRTGSFLVPWRWDPIEAFC